MTTQDGYDWPTEHEKAPEMPAAPERMTAAMVQDLYLQIFERMLEPEPVFLGINRFLFRS